MSKVLLSLLSVTGVWVGVLGLAAFLTLFWVLRGAPVGQAVTAEDDEDAPRGGYRDRVVSAVCAGMLLILAGAYIAFTLGIPWSIPPFVLGFGTVLALVAVNQRYRHGSPSLRRTVDLSNAALNAALFAGVLIVVNVIAFRYGGRALDLTRDRAFSLSSLTTAQLKTLPRPVTFTTFFGRSAAAAQQFDRVQQLLELYRAANPEKVRTDHVDPFRDLPRYQDLVKRVPAVDVTQGGGVVVEYGDGETADRVVVRNADLFDLPRAARFDPDAERYESVFKGEDAVTTALIHLREGKKSKVVFTTGHGEPSVDDMETNRSGLGVFKSRLSATGSDVAAVNLLTEDVPVDASLVAVVGPKTPFKPEEVARLRACSDRKQPLLLVLGEGDTAGLETWLQGFGIEVGRGYAAEPRLSYRGRREAVLVPVVGQRHPVLEPLNNELVLMMRAAPLKIPKANDRGTAGVTTAVTGLLRTSAESWVESDASARVPEKDDKDTPGPLDLGAAVSDRPRAGEPPPGAPRLVVFSSRYMADNAMIQIAPSNLDLLMNAANWLRGRSDLRGIPPKSHVALTLTADPGVRARLVLVPTVMSVLLIVTFGVATYLARRV